MDLTIDEIGNRPRLAPPVERPSDPPKAIVRLFFSAVGTFLAIIVMAWLFVGQLYRLIMRGEND